MLKKVIILINQAGNSAYTLILSIIIIRSAGIEQYGSFAQYSIVALFFSAVINAFISQPMVSLASKMKENQRDEIVCSSVLGFVLSLLVGVGVLIVGYIIAKYFGVFIDVYLIAIFAGSFVTCEFIRRLFFLYDAVWSATIFDISRFLTVGVLMTSDIGFQDNSHWQGVVKTISYSFIFYIAVVCVMNINTVADGWARVKKDKLYMVAKEGSALSISAIFLLMAEYTSAVTLSLAGNSSDLGIIRAAQSVCGVLNPVLYSMEYTIPKVLGGWVRDTGVKAAREWYIRTARVLLLLTALGMSLFSIVLYKYVDVIYGKALLGHEMVLPILMIAVFFSFSQNIIYFYIRALGRVYIITISSFITVVLILLVNIVCYNSAGLNLGVASVVLSKAIPCILVLVMGGFLTRLGPMVPKR